MSSIQEVKRTEMLRQRVIKALKSTGLNVRVDRTNNNKIIIDIGDKENKIRLAEGTKQGMRFRKKPIVVEAIQWKFENWSNICDFVPVPDVLYVPKGEEGKERPKLKIKTLEGEMTVNYGDWIIKGVAGEYYACKPNIFEKTYEKVG